jgi:prephenate dehydrogenase
VNVFERVTVIGVGLIGGSLGMAIRARGLAREVVGVTRVESAIPLALARRAIDRGTADPVAGVRGADLIVLATPPDQVVSLAQRVRPNLRSEAIVTDVASVKTEIVRGAGGILPPQGGAVFVGGHPMAGNEGQGITAADPDLFEQTSYLLTPTAQTPPAAVERLAELARALGAVPVVMTPEEHDDSVAMVSHLPYLVAAALMSAAVHAVPVAGPAFLGATRVAGSPVALWAQICRLNQEPIQNALRAFREELARLEAAIEDGELLDGLLEAARRARLQLGAAAREKGSK